MSAGGSCGQRWRDRAAVTVKFLPYTPQHTPSPYPTSPLRNICRPGPKQWRTFSSSDKLVHHVPPSPHLSQRPHLLLLHLRATIAHFLPPRPLSSKYQRHLGISPSSSSSHHLWIKWWLLSPSPQSPLLSPAVNLNHEGITRCDSSTLLNTTAVVVRFLFRCLGFSVCIDVCLSLRIIHNDSNNKQTKK